MKKKAFIITVKRLGKVDCKEIFVSSTGSTKEIPKRIDFLKKQHLTKEGIHDWSLYDDLYEWNFQELPLTIERNRRKEAIVMLFILASLLFVGFAAEKLFGFKWYEFVEPTHKEVW